jgi:hypothetical protein
MNQLYLDCFSGISGNMFLGMAIDLGLSEEALKEQLNKLGISEEYTIEVSEVMKNGIKATYVEVVLNEEHHHHHHEAENYTEETHHGVFEMEESHKTFVTEEEHEHGHKDEEHHHHHGDKKQENHHHDDEKQGHHHHEEKSEGRYHHHEHRNYRDIAEIIDRSGLKESVRKMAKAIFKRVALAEGKVHNKPFYEVHFHEVGATDSIVDICGAAIALDLLEIDQVYTSAINTGTGFIKCAHGVMPVPAPATVEILADSNLSAYNKGDRFELATPTGLAILAEIAEPVEPGQEITYEKTGYGAGTLEYETPNLIRGILSKKKALNKEELTLLETNIDDMTGEIAGHVFEILINKPEIRDVFYTPVFMKKNRPAYRLSVLCETDKVKETEKLIFRETSTIGIREYPVRRETMSREQRKIMTSWGEVEIKACTFEEIRKTTLEYESVKKLAEKSGKSVYEMMDLLQKEI